MSFILANEDQHQILNNLKDLLPAILQAVASSVEDQEQDTLMKYLIDLAESTPKFLRSQLDNIINLCLKVSSCLFIGDRSKKSFPGDIWWLFNIGGSRMF